MVFRVLKLTSLICLLFFGVVMNTSAQNMNDKIVSVLDFGAVGNGVADDSDAFQKAIINCINKKQILYIPKTKKSYNLNKTIRVSLSRGEKIKIISNKATLTPKVIDVSTAYKLTSFKEHVFISIGREFSSILSPEISDQNYGTEISISGLIVEGINQNYTENITSYNDDIYIGAQFVAEKVIVEDCIFKNIFGYGIRIHEVSESKIKGCEFINVGGRGLTPFANKKDLDAFGDAIFHAKINRNANIAIEECNFYGKKNKEKRSRSALTFEFSLYSYTVNLKKLNIQGYAKGLHVEENATTVFELEKVHISDFNFGIVNVLNDKTIMNLNKCTLNVAFNDGNDSGDALAFLNYKSSAKIYVKRSYMNFNGKKGAYQSATGLARVENSTIDGNNTNFFFADGNTEFLNCKFINFGGAGMSFFSNNSKNKYKIINSTFTGNPVTDIKATNVGLEIKNN